MKLIFSETPKTGFLATRPICHILLEDERCYKLAVLFLR